MHADTSMSAANSAAHVAQLRKMDPESELAKVIEGNLGTYLNRAYQAFANRLTFHGRVLSKTPARHAGRGQRGARVSPTQSRIG